MIQPTSNDLITQQHSKIAAAGRLSPVSPSVTMTYSTYWVPLEGAIQYWLDVGREATLATALSAAGSALFALSHEKRALRCYTQGWRDYWCGAHHQAQDAFHQTRQHLSAAAQHWSRVARLLDVLSVEQQQALPADELSRIRALSRTASEQQARLCKLADEVRADLAAAQQTPHPAGTTARPQQHQEEASHEGR